MNVIMSDDPVFMKMLKDMASEIRGLRQDLIRLQSIVEDKKTKGRFLTMAEACDYLKVSRGTMTKRLSDGEINFATKRGKSWLFPEEKLKAYASGMA